MQVVSAREFRSNQGNFKIIPVSEEDSMTTRICKGLEQVKLMREGKIKGYSVEEALNEL